VAELTNDRHRPFGPKAEHFRELLRHYPDVAFQQVDEMVSVYGELTILEVALLSADEAVARRFEAFMRDHAGRLRKPWQQHVILAIAVIGPILLILMLTWDAMS